MRFRATTTLLFAVMLVAAVTRADEARPTVESVSERVMCLCGCVTTMNNCPHKDISTYVCYPTWQEMKTVIQKDIAAGEDETAILQDLAIRYGVQALAAPPGRGFNLTAWVLPGLGLILGLACVMVIVRRWRQPAAVPVGAAAPPADPKLLAAVEEEMRNSGLGTRDSGLGSTDSAEAVSSGESRIPKPGSR